MSRHYYPYQHAQKFSQGNKHPQYANHSKICVDYILSTAEIKA